MSGGTTPAPVQAGKVEIEFKGPLWDGRGGALLVRNLRVALLAGAARVEKIAVERTPVNTGLLRGSLGARVTTVGAPDAHGVPERIEAEVGSPLTYGPHVEYGTKAHWPPAAPIEAWVRRKMAGAIEALAASAKTRARAAGLVSTIEGQRTKAQSRRLVALVAREHAVKSLTFLVRRAIAKRGTKGSAALRTAVDQSRAWTLGAVEAAVRAWAEEMSKSGGNASGASGGVT